MNCCEIDLYSYFKRPRCDKAEGTLSAYLQADYTNVYGARRRPAMIVFPGGGYHFRSERENECIAIKYLSEGFNVFVLNYSVAPVRYPVSLVEAAMSIAYIKENSESLLVDKAHVAVIGFSAGGHLAGSIATMFDEPYIRDAIGTRDCRPDAAVFSYAVLSSKKGITHENSIKNLLGDNIDVTRDNVSIEDRVTQNSSPAFIWHTVEDEIVPVMNSLLVAKSYREHGVPFELHIFEHGAHGISLATRETVNDKNKNFLNADTAEWFNLSVKWLKSRGFCINK